ncbi:MAG: DUF4167 domain-containing protein [Alphaproteobacteria bacterium]|nr:DUF4167 domain-containing protein [Alphaproteobacteria bacterium]
MRQGPHNKRGRGRGGNNNRRSGTPNRNQTFDSNGPDIRIRGNANQVHEKYLNLARDAAQNGDRVLAESYFQHAEHYYRIISAFTEETGGDANRNRGNGVHHNANDEAQGNHFQEGEPQPELNLSTANAAPEQPSPAREQTQPTSNATSNASSDAAAEAPGGEATSSEAATPKIAEAAPVEAPTAGEDDAPRPARRPLSLRRRRSSTDEAPAPRAPASESTTPGVTVTVVGAPVVEPSEPAPPPKPRRRPRAAPAPVQAEENPGD